MDWKMEMRDVCLLHKKDCGGVKMQNCWVKKKWIVQTNLHLHHLLCNLISSDLDIFLVDD